MTRHSRATIGRTIRFFRRKNKLRLVDMVKKTGLSLSYLGEIERDEKVPTASALLNVATASGAPIERVFRLAHRSCDTCAALRDVLNQWRAEAS